MTEWMSPSSRKCSNASSCNAGSSSGSMACGRLVPGAAAVVGAGTTYERAEGRGRLTQATEIAAMCSSLLPNARWYGRHPGGSLHAEGPMSDEDVLDATNRMAAEE